MTQKTTFPAPSLEEAGQLYQAAVRVKELAPWGWMEESDIFGVQQPETGELGFVSVMGMAEEHFAVALYQGAEGLYGLWDLASGDLEENPQRLLEIPQLQASFEDRDGLDKQDREVIKKLGLKFRGAHAWPMFRSYRPGFMPWYVTAEEARFLTLALEQTLAVAPRVRENPDLLVDEDDEEDESYLVRVPRREGDQFVWEEQMMRVPAPESVSVPVVLDVETIGQLKQLPQRNFALEIDVLAMPTPIGERGERPSLPYLLMLADARSGMIIGFELMKVESSLAEMQAQIPLKLSHTLAQAGAIPADIFVRSELLLQLLNPLCQILQIKLELSDLPGINRAMDSMLEMMGGFCKPTGWLPEIGTVGAFANHRSIQIERIPVRLVLLLIGALHCFAEFFFEDALAIFERAEFLVENLLAQLFLLFHPLSHLFKRRDWFRLLFMRDERAGLRVNVERGFAARADDRVASGFGHGKTPSAAAQVAYDFVGADYNTGASADDKRAATRF
ncbi:hypothetical protein BH18ACI2_BH18ACI2_02590 [soil metagenome]